MAEWKYDGIRVQLVSTPAGKALFSRSGDDISAAFPDVIEGTDLQAVADGELLVKSGGAIASFNHLQQRLNRKAPDPKLIAQYPAHIILYDMLAIGGRDIRPLPLLERKVEMERWFQAAKPRGIELAQPLAFRNPGELQTLRAQASHLASPHVEGLMLKRKNSPYIPGRPKGQWYKWKRDPLLVDAVVMYAQRGSGRRSSFYSDYTFGLWRNGELIAPLARLISASPTRN